MVLFLFSVYASLLVVLCRDVMSAPALVIIKHAPIAYAAGLMLKHKVSAVLYCALCTVRFPSVLSG